MKQNYSEVARRSLLAANAASSRNLNEKSAFLAYHAFESSGCALGAHIGLEMGKHVNHVQKLRRFVHATKQVRMPHRLCRHISDLSVTLAAMRNLLLYPELLPDGSVKNPEEQITPADARVLLKQVAFIKRHVDSRL